MTEHTHRFRVGQTVGLLTSTFRPAATGHYKIIGLRPMDDEIPRYRIKSESELHERVVAENDLVPSALVKFE